MLYDVKFISFSFKSLLTRFQAHRWLDSISRRLIFFRKQILVTYERGKFENYFLRPTYLKLNKQIFRKLRYDCFPKLNFLVCVMTNFWDDVNGFWRTLDWSYRAVYCHHKPVIHSGM